MQLNKFELKIVILYLAILINSAISEWIQISQGQTLVQSNVTTPNTAIPRVYKVRKHYSNSSDDIIEINENQPLSTPSIEWVQYQRERFRPHQNVHTHKLIVTGNDGLKNSAQVVVPAIVSKHSTQSPNKIFHSKTQFDIVSNKNITNLKKLPHTANMETTSRREMSYVNTQDNEDDEIYDADEDQGTGFVKPIAAANGNVNKDSLAVPSITGFIAFLKSIQTKWLFNTGFSIEKKIKAIKKLRDNLMWAIENQFSILFKTRKSIRRSKRGLLEESNLNFPPEAALLSINFLTFAVFLIKLVLQVVNIVKSKHYNFNGFTNVSSVRVDNAYSTLIG